jgi:SAM-dependent methyltransferase
MHREIDTEKFWDQEVVDPMLTSWMEDPLVREYINTSIGRSEPMWPIDWFQRWLEGRTFRRALSIGCGSGALERDLVRKNLVDSIDAFDGSTNSLRIARQTADREGIGKRIRYFAADFNEPVLPRGTYDAVFIHQAAHHVAKLEKLYRAILHSMTDDAVLYLDEYIGPSRFDWNDRSIAPHRAAFESYPAGARRVESLPLPIHAYDPSEAFRSDEILPQMRIGFDLAELRGYGGNLVSVIYPFIDWQNAKIDRLIEREKEVLRNGELPYYAIIVARPKRGIAKAFASLRYFTEPKVKRLLREIRDRKSKPAARPSVKTHGS